MGKGKERAAKKRIGRKKSFLALLILVSILILMLLILSYLLYQQKVLQPLLTGATTLGIQAEGSEDLSWNKTFDGGRGSADIAWNVVTDTDGNVYVAGLMNTTPTSNVYWWIKKFNSSGTENTTNWNLTFDAGMFSNNWAIAYLTLVLDNQRNLYLVGNRNTSVSNFDWWIKKIDAAGTEDTINWNKSIDSGVTGNDVANSVAIDSVGDVYVVGDSRINSRDWWIKKFNSSGTEDIANWNKTFGTAGSEGANSVILDNNRDVYVVGTISMNSTNSDLWIKKFNSSGTEDITNWNKTFDNAQSLSDTSWYVTVDTAKNVYVVGNNGLNGGDWWIQKFNSSGTEDSANWNKTFDSGGAQEQALSVTVDSLQQVYAGGFISSNGNDWWIKKFNSSGTENTTQWNLTFSSGSGNDFTNSVTIDHDGNLYAVGQIAINGDDWWIKKLNGTPQNFPQVNISTPRNGSNLTGSVLFNVSIKEATIETVLFSFANGTPFNVTPSNTSGYWNTTLNICILDEGLRRMTVLAEDKAGNFNRTEFVEFTVDCAAPTVTVSCTPAQAVEGQTVTCTCSGSDSGSGLRRSPQFGDGGTSESTTATGTGGTSSECSATDYAGNIASGTSSWTLTTTSGGGSGGGGGGGGGAQGTAAGASLPASAKSEIPSTEESVSQEYYTSIPEIVSYLHLEPTPVESEITTPAAPSAEEAAPPARELRPVEEQVPGQIPVESRFLLGREETFPVAFSNTGDKAIKIKPIIEVEKKIVHEERATEIIREKIIREAARKGIDLTSTELSQEIEQQIIYLHLREDENIQYLLGKVFTFGSAEELLAEEKSQWNFSLRLFTFLRNLFHALMNGLATLTGSAVAGALTADLSFDTAARHSVNGIIPSKQIVTGKILLPELLDTEELIIPPGETIYNEFRIVPGISSKPKDITIAFSSQDQKIIKKTVTTTADIIFGGAVEVNTDDNLLDLYYVIPPLEKNQEVSFEVTLTRPGSTFLTQTAYLELFGPHHLSSSTPTMLAQQFHYDDERYQDEYELTLTLLLDNKIIARQSYPVSLD